MSNLKSILITSLIFLSSCATSRKIDFEEVSKNEGVILGSIKILFNGKVKHKCSIQFADNNQKRYVFTQDETTNVALIVPKGKISIKKVICTDGSPYTYMFSKNHILNIGDRMISYFGNVEIDWKVKGGMKGSFLFGGAGAGYEAGKDESEGTATLSLQTRGPASNANGVVSEFKKLNGNIKKSKFKKSLLQIVP